MGVPKIGRRSVASEAVVQEPQQVEVQEGFVSPEVAANSLMRYLPTDAQMFISEAAEQMQLPKWQMLLGYVMRCADRFELFSPHILSQWESGGMADAPRPCGTCGEEFTSKFPDARFCCDRCFFQKVSELGHTDSCPVKVK